MSTPEVSNSSQSGLAFKSAAGPLLILMGVFFANFTSRLLLAPLLPTLETALHLDHAQAGSLFLYSSAGYFVTLMASGFVAAKLTHRVSIILSALVLCLAQFGMALADSYATLALSLVGVGLACGVYLPCAMATLYRLVRPLDWGKAVAMHELAPNLSFLIIPVLCALLLTVFSWQKTASLFAVLTLVLGVLFVFKGKGGRFRGQAPTLSALKTLASDPSFWIMVPIFSLSIGSSIGIYTMLPLYLVAERGLDQSWANTLVGLSRILSVGTAFAAGWLTDMMGVKRALRIYLLISGTCSLCLGLVPDSLLVLFLFLQPMATVCLFPANFATLAKVGPVETRNLAISFIIPPSFLIGTGAIPALIGVLGDLGYFGWGISLVGVAVISTATLLVRLRLDQT